MNLGCSKKKKKKNIFKQICFVLLKNVERLLIYLIRTYIKNKVLVFFRVVKFCWVNETLKNGKSNKVWCNSLRYVLLEWWRRWLEVGAVALHLLSIWGIKQFEAGGREWRRLCYYKTVIDRRRHAWKLSQGFSCWACSWDCWKWLWSWDHGQVTATFWACVPSVKWGNWRKWLKSSLPTQTFSVEESIFNPFDDDVCFNGALIKLGFFSFGSQEC